MSDLPSQPRNEPNRLRISRTKQSILQQDGTLHPGIHRPREIEALTTSTGDVPYTQGCGHSTTFSVPAPETMKNRRMKVRACIICDDAGHWPRFS